MNALFVNLQVRWLVLANRVFDYQVAVTLVEIDKVWSEGSGVPLVRCTG